MQAVELDRRLAQMSEDKEPKTPTRIKETQSAWYFDRLGKLERYRRHIYSISWTPYNK